MERFHLVGNDSMARAYRILEPGFTDSSIVFCVILMVSTKAACVESAIIQFNNYRIALDGTARTDRDFWWRYCGPVFVSLEPGRQLARQQGAVLTSKQRPRWSRVNLAASEPLLVWRWLTLVIPCRLLSLDLE